MGDRARRLAGTSARAAKRATASASHAARSAAMSTSRATRAGAKRVRKATTAQGAGESGLSRVIELNAVNAVGDTLITIALADTLFFSAATSEARSQVALYLLVTMAPFAVVAPVIGPFLDRFRHGRRWAIGTSTAVRAFLAWVMASSIVRDDLWLYPAAFGVLVASRAFAVARSAAVPRVLPPSIQLVTANSRLGLAGVVGTAVAAPIGIGLAAIGSNWPLYLAFIAYVTATVLAILLSSKVDSAAGERGVTFRDGSGTADRTQAETRSLSGGTAARPAAKTAARRPRRPPRRKPYRAGPALVRALRANTMLRGFNGFLTMFVAFLLREQSVAGMADYAAIGMVVAAAWVGSAGGTALGAAARARSPDRTVLVLVVIAAVVAVLCALLWGVVMAVTVGLVAGFGQQLGRLSLDAVVQRDVPDEVRTSAFARSETLLQLSWVLGGFLGISLPPTAGIGFGLAAGILVAGLILAARARPGAPIRPRLRSTRRAAA